MIYKATGNLRAIQMLGHTKIENTVRYRRQYWGYTGTGRAD